MSDIRKGQTLGGIGAFLGFLTAVGIVTIAAANSDTQWAYVDASVSAAVSILALWSIVDATRQVRRASITLLAAGVVGFFMTGIVWLPAGGLMLAGAFVLRREFSE